LSIEATGADIEYASVDVCDASALSAAVERAERRWGEPVAAVFHLAGVVTANGEDQWSTEESRLRTRESQEAFHRTLKPKVHGTLSIHRVLSTRPGAAFVAFSSLMSVFPGTAIAGYSTANAFLDSYSQYLRASGRTGVYCLNWPMWEDVGMSRSAPAYAKAAARSLGFAMMSREQGWLSLLTVLYRSPGQTLVGWLPATAVHYPEGQTRLEELVAYTVTETGNVPDKVSALRCNDRFGAPTPCRPVRLSQLLRDKSGHVNRNSIGCKSSQGDGLSALEQRLADAWFDVLGVRPDRAEDNFFSLGGESLRAMRLISRVRETFGVSLSLSGVFRAPTLRSLAGIIALNGSCGRIGDAESQLPANDLSSVDELSEREIDELLATLTKETL
jgi:hypothetical protein